MKHFADLGSGPAKGLRTPPLSPVQLKIAWRASGLNSPLGRIGYSRYTPNMVSILKLLLAVGTGFVMWALL